jgi:hypothetical protein
MRSRRRGSVGIANRLRDGKSEVHIPAGERDFSPKRPNGFWCPSSLLLNGYWGSFLGVKRPEREVDGFLLVPGLRKGGAMPLLPHMPLWSVQGELYPLDDDYNNNNIIMFLL